MTVEFGVLYLATDGLYAEVARVPGLLEEMSREFRVMILGPSLFPALLRTVQLGHVTLALEEKADQIRELLGATKTEMGKMDVVLGKLAKNAIGDDSIRSRPRERARARSVGSCGPWRPWRAQRSEALAGVGGRDRGHDGARGSLTPIGDDFAVHAIAVTRALTHWDGWAGRVWACRVWACRVRPSCPRKRASSWPSHAARLPGL